MPVFHRSTAAGYPKQRATESEMKAQIQCGWKLAAASNISKGTESCCQGADGDLIRCATSQKEKFLETEKGSSE